MHVHLVSKAGSLIRCKSEGGSSAIMNVILRSLSVNAVLNGAPFESR